MTKICTTIEQSKKLTELGLSRETSDMFYWCGTDLRIGGYKAQDKDTDISAWSLSALLDIIPESDKRNENYVSAEHHAHFNQVRLVNCWDGGLHSEYSNGDLLDVLYDMICWMLKHNKL